MLVKGESKKETRKRRRTPQDKRFEGVSVISLKSKRRKTQVKRNEDVTNEEPMLTRKRKKGEETAKNSLRSLYVDINKDMVKMIKGCNVQRESMREGRVLAESDVI